VAGVETTVVVVSDSHLSALTPDALANWDVVVGYIDDFEPDLVIHLGDLTADASHDPVELVAAREQLDRLTVPWRAIPGNHDIGDNPRRGMPGDATVNPDRLAHWRETIGHDWWSCEIGAWTLLAVDAQLFGSGLEAERAQWIWLAQQVAQVPHDGPVGLLTHKPLTAPEDELAAAPPDRFVPTVARRRIEALASGSTVPLVLSGHIHQFRILDFDDRRHVWAPTTWAVLPDSVQRAIGAKRCGVVSLSLPVSGHADISLVEPPGISQLTVTEVPNPYSD